MAKKVGKKARSVHKGKRVPASSPKVVPRMINQSPEVADDGTSALKERILCIHVEKGICLDKLSSKIGLEEPRWCEDCREGWLIRGQLREGINMGRRKELVLQIQKQNPKRFGFV
ncbi:hypothetical protein Nepgr_022132 [Nepenthes gracilis]|uniref:Uncharacterized protein n=1 Tax=Nepenthes gracilis TaxID=150966 RepID=A0AAD3T095_NEPGR|nr:hypothetical protein Nepgr_022132 [Nepenthes gracilis]